MSVTNRTPNMEDLSSNSDDTVFNAPPPPPPLETYYKIKIDDLEFQYLYKEMGMRKIVYVIDSRGKECATIYVDENTEDADNNTRELLLSKITYKPQCAFGAHMMRGLSTIKMLKGLMSFAMKMIPGYPYIVFTDDSTIDCELPNTRNKVTIPLACLEFVLHGKTWYERHFGAVLDEGDVDRRAKLDAANTLLSQPVEGDFKPFWRKMLRLGNALRNIEWYRQLVGLVEEVYATHVADKKSWRSFYNELFSHTRGIVSATLGENVGCSLFTSMQTPIEEMFNIPILHQTHWKVMRQTIESYPEYAITAEPNAAPIHIKKTNTEMKLAAAAAADQLLGLYTIGGGKTLSNKRKLKNIPRGYGGVISFLTCGKHRARGKTTKAYRTAPHSPLRVELTRPNNSI